MRNTIRSLAAAAVIGTAAGGASAQQGQAVQWRVEDGGNGHWYATVRSPTVISWTAAAEEARAQGGHLATPTLPDENQFVYSVAQSQNGWSGLFGPWLGGYVEIGLSECDPTSWRWVDGEPWQTQLAAWCSPQPDCGDETRLHYWYCTAGWNNAVETGEYGWGSVKTYMIEWSADCNNDGIVDYGQIASGELADENENFIPDCCEDKVLAWGNTSGYGQYGQASPPDISESVAAISAGHDHSVCLLTTGQVLVWGYNAYGQCNVPQGLGPVTQVAAGDRFVLALRSNGQVVGWGFNNKGQCNPPSGLSPVRAVSAGGSHSIAQRQDLTLVCWGDNSYGQSSIPSNLGAVTLFDGGVYHTTALSQVGMLRCWGLNDYGQCNPPSGLNEVIDLSAGDRHTVALTDDGRPHCWGWNLYGQCSPPADLPTLMAISASDRHTLGLTTEGVVVRWGQPHGNLPGPDVRCSQIAAGAYHGMAVPQREPCSADCNADGISDAEQVSQGELADYNSNLVPDCCESGTPCVVGNYPVQWRETDGGNGHWYRARPTPESWTAAQSAAQSAGGHLVTVTSDAEHEFVKGLWQPAAPGRGVWAGGTRVTDPACNTTECEWEWVTGEPWSYSAWTAGEPNNDGGAENRLEILRTLALTWNDESSATLMPSIVEWSTDCNGDGEVDHGQILRGELADANADGIPDACRRVPQQYATIQGAINAAPASGITGIVVAPGTYTESLNLSGKAVRIIGAGPGSTTVQAPVNSQVSVVRATNEPVGALIQGIRIRGGLTGTTLPETPSVRVGGGIFADLSALALRNSIVEDNVAGFGGGAYLRRCTGSVIGCTFRDNSSGADGGGVQIAGGSLTVEDTAVLGNHADGRGGGLHVTNGGVHTLRRVAVSGNDSGVAGGISFVWLASFGTPPGRLTIDGCTVTSNEASVTQGGIGIFDETPEDVQVTVKDTEACANAPLPNISGPWTDLGGNGICDCRADVNTDARIDGIDLATLLSQWGPATASSTCDFDASGSVNATDLSFMLAAWGDCGG